MQITDIVSFLGSIPVWAWVIGVLAVMFATGDRTLWDYEVKFPLKDGVGRGKVELEGKKKKGPCIECVFELDHKYQREAIDVFLNGHQIHRIQASDNNSGRVRVLQSISISEPNEGDIVTVHIGGKELFSGPLVLD